MRLFIVAFLAVFISISGYPQGQQSRGVSDPDAVELSPSLLLLLRGDWRVKEARETLRDSVREINFQFSLISFLENGAFLAKACRDCYRKEVGTWEIIEGRWVKIATKSDSGIKRDFELGGDWTVHVLTPKDLILVKRLTTSGSWYKKWTFERVD